MKMSFKQVWTFKARDLRQWIFYNVGIGLLPVWFSWVVLAFGNVFQFKVPFLDGSILIFTATLSGSSMSFFAEESKLNLQRTKRFLFNGLLTVVLFGACGFSAIIALKQFAPAKLYPELTFWASVAVLFLALYFNLYLAGLRSVYSDPELLEQFMQEEATEKAWLTEKAKAANQVDGDKL